MKHALVLCALVLAGVSVARAQTYKARLVLEDGTPIPSSPMIIPEPSSGCRIVNVFGTGVIEYFVDVRYAYPRPRSVQEIDICPVTIRLTGYRTLKTSLRDTGTVVLKRMGDEEGATVSATTLRAPKDARKAYEKGVAALTSGKLPEARKELERAVAAYPEYAPAWSDLGEVLLRQGQAQPAKDAWERALKADPKYIKPYVQLSRLAITENRMQDAIMLVDKALTITPAGSSTLYFHYAVANYSLGHLDDAEKSVKRAIELDAEHDNPRAEFIFGSILQARGDRAGAIQHFQKYLHLSPKAADAAQVRQRIAQLEQSPAP